MITCGETLRIIGMPLIVLQNKLIINQGLSVIDRNRLEAAFEKVSPHLMISIRDETLPLQSLSIANNNNDNDNDNATLRDETINS